MNQAKEIPQAHDRYFIAYDAGGTMTDCVVCDTRGNVALGKALTDYADESSSFLESTTDAAAYADLPVDDVFGASESIVYAGTIMLNMILSYSGQKVGILITAGLEDYLTMQKGEGVWLGLSYSDRLHSATHFNKKPYVPRQQIMGISERIALTGDTVIPLDENEVGRAAARLLAQGCEAIGIVFLYSPLNPAHERRAREIVTGEVERAGADVPVIISSELAPTLKEYTRLTSVVLQAYVAEPSREQYRRVQDTARAHGYKGDVHTLLAHGGVAKIDYPRLYEAFTAGPVGGVIGAKYVGETLGLQDIVVTDVGGTSFDVGIIRGGIVPVEREPVVLHNRVSLPMVHTESIGAGTGSELKINPVSQRLEIGPKSAGPKTGLCYDYPLPTITDVDVALGYLNPDYFLGGSVKLDPERARAGVARLAAEFSQEPDAFAAGVLGVFHETMRQHLVSMVLGRGYLMSEYSLFCYGGGGPMHLFGYERDMGFKNVVTFPFAANFSAFGILTTDRIHRYHQAVVAAVPPGGDPASEAVKAAGMSALNGAFAALRERALDELTSAGVDEREIGFQHFVYVRYTTQLYDFEVPLPFGELASRADLDRLVAEFERVYSTLYPKAGASPEAGYLILEVALTAAVRQPRPEVPRFPLAGTTPADEARKPSRQAYWEGEWLPWSIYEMDLLHAGNVVPGPAILEDPATTLVVPPDRQARLDEHRCIWFEPK